MGSNAAVSLKAVDAKKRPSLPAGEEMRYMGHSFIRNVRFYYTPNQFDGADPYYLEYSLNHHGRERENDPRVQDYLLTVLGLEARRCDKYSLLGVKLSSAQADNFFSARIEFGSSAMGQLKQLEKFRLKLEKAFLRSVEHGSRVFGCF